MQLEFGTSLIPTGDCWVAVHRPLVPLVDKISVRCPLPTPLTTTHQNTLEHWFMRNVNESYSVSCSKRTLAMSDLLPSSQITELRDQ